MLVPVVKFCLRHSVKLPDLIECCKATLVEQGRQELDRTQQASSVSRVTVMTGVHRRDVNRLSNTEIAPKESTNIITRVIGQWHQDPDFLTPSGRPRVLSVEGDPSDFTRLVRSVSSDLNPYTVLYELERLELVRRGPSGLRLASHLFVPKGNIKQGMQFLATDTAELMQAIEENLAEINEIPNYHIKTEYDDVTRESVPAIRAWLLQQGSELHHRARNFIAQHDREINPALKDKEGGVRVVIGGFSRVQLPPQQ